MDDVTSGALVSDPETRRALQLDTLSAILPMERRDRLAELLTDDDVATLKHLAQEGLGENPLRALASDLAYLEAWAQAATGAALPWPASESLALKFVAHHLWDPAKRETDPQHGMPAGVAAALRESEMLRSTGPHAPSTVKRRLASWGTLHRWKGQEGPLASPSLRSALRLAVRASTRPRRRKSKRAVTRDVLDRLLATCRSDRLADTRDLAILLLAFASGGRRRSEVAGCGSSSSTTNRLSRLIRRIQNPRRYRAWPFSSAAPRPAKRMRRGGCCWSGRRSRRCASGSNGPTSARGRSSVPSTVGRRWRRGR
jgi:integrase